MTTKALPEPALVLAAKIEAMADKGERIAAFQLAGGKVEYVSPSIGHRARAFGLSSTCTASADGAVVNWLGNVRKRTAP